MRADFSSYQGEGPQACWRRVASPLGRRVASPLGRRVASPLGRRVASPSGRQVKGLQRRYDGKDAAGLYRFRLRLV